MARLELTTTFKAISTSPKARKSHSPAAATGRVKAAARYALRDTAAPEGEVSWSGPRLDACPDRKAARLAFGQAVEERSKQGGAVGRRLASTLIVSLPNDWPKAAQVEAMKRLTAHLAPVGSEAIAIGAIHRDKPHNTHMHFVVLDGLEHQSRAVLRAHGRAKEQVGMLPPPPAPPKVSAPVVAAVEARGRTAATPTAPEGRCARTASQCPAPQRAGAAEGAAPGAGDHHQRRGGRAGLGGRRMAVLRGPRYRQDAHHPRRPPEARPQGQGGPAAARAGGGACGTTPATRTRSPALRL